MVVSPLVPAAAIVAGSRATLPVWLPRVARLMGARVWDLLWDLRWGWARQAMHWVSAHTGVPAIVVAAVLIVVLYRVAKRSLRFVAQVSVVLLLLAVLAHLGILRF